MTLDVLQDRIGYRFKDESLLVLAVTHSSWANEHSAGNAHNERLEFLGDAVLEIAVSAQLFARFPDAREGELTRLRSSLVNEATLAVIARKLHLDDCLRLARGEENQGGRQRVGSGFHGEGVVVGGFFRVHQLHQAHGGGALQRTHPHGGLFRACAAGRQAHRQRQNQYQSKGLFHLGNTSFC